MTDGFYDELCSAVNREVQPEQRNAFWRTEDPIVDLSNPDIPKLVKGGMWPSQRKWWESKAKVKVLVGGFGSGKTMQLCKRMMSLALQNAPVPVATVSPAYTMAAKTVIPMFKALCAGKQSIYGRQFWWRYVANPVPMFKIRFHGRTGTIWCLSSDRPMSLRGTNLGAAGIDEPFIQPIEVFQEMNARVRDPDAPLQEICIAGTPEELNWGYDLCVGDLGEKHDIEVIQVSSRENRVLRPSFVRDLEASYSEKAIRAYVDGQFVNLSEGQVYYAFDPLDHVIKLEMGESAEWGCGMDFNVNPMSAVVFRKAGDRMHIVTEIELPNADTETMAITLKERFPKLTKVFPDASGKARKTSASGKTDFSILKKYGFTIHAPPGNPPIRDRENTVNGKMKPADGRVSFTVDPSCKKLIRALSIYTHELKHKAAQKKLSHLIDALGYPIHRLFPLARSGVREVTY